MGRPASAGPGLRAASGGFGRPGPRRQPRGAGGPRSWVGVLGLLHLAALRGGVEAGHCCPGADLFITKRFPGLYLFRAFRHLGNLTGIQIWRRVPKALKSFFSKLHTLGFKAPLCVGSLNGEKCLNHLF